jgi:hypothetical protein
MCFIKKIKLPQEQVNLYFTRRAKKISIYVHNVSSMAFGFFFFLISHIYRSPFQLLYIQFYHLVSISKLDMQILTLNYFLNF